MSLQRAFVDTNVLAYALDASEPAKQERAQHLLSTHGGQLVVSTQVLIELYAVCARKLGMDAADAAAAVRAVARLDVVPTDRGLVLDAVAYAEEKDVSIFDAAIACAAIRAECDTLLSEDLALAARVGELDVVDPFS